MPRTARRIEAGYAYHVLNRANDRNTLFTTPHDYVAFERVVEEAHSRHSLPILAYCVMPNHWHFVVRPREQQEDLVSAFFGLLTMTHSQRWRGFHKSVGAGHVYQGRFKAFPIATDDHLYSVLRYVERNPLRANLVERAEAWQWSSLWRCYRGPESSRAILSDWPIPRPKSWLTYVNQPETEVELAAIRRCVETARFYGSTESTTQSGRGGERGREPRID